MVVLDDGKNYIEMGNCLVEVDALRIMEAIHDYDENLEVAVLDPNRPGVKCTSAPFMVMQRMPNGTYQKVMEAWTLDMRLLERIWAADQHKNSLFQTVEDMERSIREGAEKRYREKAEEANELALAVIAARYSNYSFKNEKGDKVKINEDKPPEFNDNKKSFS